MLRDSVTRVALQLYSAIRGQLGTAGASAVVGEAGSGDYTFSIDEEAEQILGTLVEEESKRSGLRLAYYSEDRGLISHDGSEADYILVIDPIDGTRPAVCGFESCCISIAMAKRNSDLVTLSDVEAAVLVELRRGRAISADKSGVYDVPVRLSVKKEMKHLFWAFEQCARPVAATNALLGNLIDASSFGGGVFVFNSSSYAISRVITGQMDAYVDPTAALFARPGADKWIAHAKSLYDGKVFGLFAYDIAAAAFIAKNAGVCISDAFGNSLDPINLLASGPEHTLSCVAAGNDELAKLILTHIEKNFEKADAALNT